MVKRHKNKLETVPPVVVKTRASKKTKDAIAFYNGKKSAVDLFETDKRRKFVHSGYIAKDRINIDWQGVGKWAALAAVTAFVAAAAYWGMMQ